MIELRRRHSGGVQSPSFSRLPKGYQEVEYLESTGGQWIETNIPASDGTDIKIDFQLTTYIQGSCLFGAYIPNPATRWYMYWRQEKEYNFGHGQDKNVSITNPYDRHVVEYITSNKEVKIDGTVVKNFSTTINTDLNIWIFNCNDNYVGTYPIYAKVFSFYAETSTDKYALVPCYRTSDRKPGMYDIVNDVFYPNAGAGEFSYGPEVYYNIPPEYQQVEYLESTGKQYIVTDIPANDGTDVTIDFQLKSVNQQTMVVFGARSIIPERWYLYIENMAQWNFGHGENKIVNMSNVTDRHIVNYITSEDKRVEIDGVLVKSFTSQVNTELGIYIFYANNPANEPMYPCVAKIFSFKAKDTIANKDYCLIPCYDKETLIAGMYDIVNGIFYTNAGTGEFTVGPLVI